MRIIKFLLFLVLFLTSSSVVRACDACGCSMMGGYMPLLSAFHKNYASLTFHSSGYHAIGENIQGARDRFSTLDVTGQYQLTNKWSLNFTLPYKWNVRQIELTDRSVSGLSDARVNGSFLFHQSMPFEKKAGLYIEGSGGIILPVGKFDSHIHDTDLPENFNPGNGSWGISAGETFTISKKYGGLLIRSSIADFLPTASGFKFGSQFTSAIHVFTTLPLGSIIQLVPLIGVQYEHSAKDRYANSNKVKETGGYSFLATSGMQVRYRSWILSSHFAIPLHSQIGNGQVDADPRIDFSITQIL